MAVEEAINRMQEVGHPFFVFINASSGAVNVVYERKAGGSGVLVPLPPTSQ